MPRAIREALVSWDRTLYDIPVIEPEKPAPGVLYERIYDLGAANLPAVLACALRLKLQAVHAPQHLCLHQMLCMC